MGFGEATASANISVGRTVRLKIIHRSLNLLSKSMLYSNQLVHRLAYPSKMLCPNGMSRTQNGDMTGAVGRKNIRFAAELELERANRPNQLLACTK
jgi:hypothetical protein